MFDCLVLLFLEVNGVGYKFVYFRVLLVWAGQDRQKRRPNTMLRRKISFPEVEFQASTRQEDTRERFGQREGRRTRLYSILAGPDRVKRSVVWPVHAVYEVYQSVEVCGGCTTKRA